MTDPTVPPIDIRAIRTPGLGDTTYVLTYEGVTIVVDPQRDIGRFEQAVTESGGHLTMVLETHLHNDYVSGGRELAAKSGADLVVPAAAAPAYRSIPAFHLEDINAGPFVVRPIHTPGHTPEHTSFLILLDDVETIVFSGGSLLVGSAGRPDLLGVERADTLARLQYQSLNRLSQLPDRVQLMPTHGEGSFCSASGAGRSTSTIGDERRSNPVFAYPDVDSFVEGEMAGLQPYPAYYEFMGPANTFGYPDPPSERPPILSVEEVAESDAAIIDLRPKQEYADAHIPGSLGLGIGDQVGVWAGWLLDHDSEIILIANDEVAIDEAVNQLAQIGMDRVVGAHYGLEAWEEAGRLTSRHLTTNVQDLLERRNEDPNFQILDVRAPNEHQSVSLDGSIWSYLPDLADTLPTKLDTDHPVFVACGSGYRATAAVKWLEEGGFEPIVLVDAGIPDVVRAVSAHV